MDPCPAKLGPPRRVGVSQPLLHYAIFSDVPPAYLPSDRIKRCHSPQSPSVRLKRPSRCLVPSPPELQRSIRAVEVQRGADGRLYPVRAATPDERRRVRALAHALVCRGRGTESPGRGVVPGPVFFRRKDQPCSALTCWKNTLNDVPVLLSAVGNACSVPAPVPVLVAFSGLVVKNDDSVCLFPL